MSKAHAVKYIRRSDVLLGRIKSHGRDVRSWHAASGELVGCWLSRTGKVYAVGHNQQGNLIVYPAAIKNWNAV